MVDIYFTKDAQQVCTLFSDLMTGDYQSHIDNEKLSKKDLINYLRKRINDDILKGADFWQALRDNDKTLYRVVENIINVSIGENIMNSPFVDALVEVKNRKLGDSSKFYAEGGLLSVAVFAGNQWDTNRQALDLGSEVSLPAQWLSIHVYEELERFLQGITPLEKLIEKMDKSFNKEMQDRIYRMFAKISNCVPAEYMASGNSEESFGRLCDLVQSKGGYNELTIAGTKGAFRRLAAIIPEKMFADSQRESKASIGTIGTWEGNTLVTIPQTLKSGSDELALDDTQLFILGGDTRPIKLEIYGETRAIMDFTGTKNNDQTVDAQVQTRVGMGLIPSKCFGMFTFA